MIEEQVERAPAASAESSGGVRQSLEEMIAAKVSDDPVKQDKMRRIIKVMKGSPDIVSYNPTTLEMKLHGFVHPQTNLFDILNFVSSQNPNPKNEPQGVDHFLSAMALAGLSPNLISSKRLKPFITGARPISKSSSSGQLGTGAKKKAHVISWIKLYR